MAEVSISAAARLTKKGRSTIQRYVKEGKLSAGRDAAGNPVIDIAELMRVFGSIHADDTGEPVSASQDNTPSMSQAEAAIIDTLREELRAAREREEWLKGQLEAEQERSRELERRMLPAGTEATAKRSFLARLFGK